MARATEELLTGILEHAAFYESTGERHRCVVSLRVGAEARMLVFDADVRDRLPVGRRMQLRFRRSLAGDTMTLLASKLL